MAEHDFEHSDESAKKDPSYVYIWDYDEQTRTEKMESNGKQRKGVRTYAILVTVAFALCFVLLIGTLLWKIPQGINLQAGSEIPTTQIAEQAYPATVLITARNSSGYSFGTGFFIRSDGYIATNCHVISGAVQIEITLYSGQRLPASVIGYHAASDLAVLKIDGSGYPVIPIGNSDLLRVGERAVSIGNPDGEEAAWTVTQGIVSAINRTILVESAQYIVEMKMIQTDAPVNPGNSGGPLCNGKGEVIGIITRKLSDTESIGFAIPINGAMEILNAILKNGSADAIDSSIIRVRPKMGIQGGSIQEGTRYTYGGNAYIAQATGVFVQIVNRDGAAYNLLQPGDIITHLDGKRVTSMDEMLEILYKHKIGDIVRITVIRGDTELSCEITLGKS